MRNLSDYSKTLPGSEALPYGMLKNESRPGAGDGTDIKAEQLQDLYYALYQVLGLAGQVPNGKLENGQDNRQFLTALAQIGWFKYDSSLVYHKNAIVVYLCNNSVQLYLSLVDNNRQLLSDSESWQLIFEPNAYIRQDLTNLPHSLNWYNAPSEKYIDLTWEGTGMQYIMPDDGYLTFCRQSGNGTVGTERQVMIRAPLLNHHYFEWKTEYPASSYISAYVVSSALLAKGTVASIHTNCEGRISWFRFIYTNLSVMNL